MIHLHSGTELSESLFAAPEKDELVVFAGAGISAGPPAYLPNFERLVEMVSRGEYRGAKRKIPPDQFLGKLQQRKVPVHDEVKKYLRAADPSPTVLHREILRLFGARSNVRVVTTNFDTLFRDAAVQVYGAPPELYVGPALPDASRFRGIVKLHGDLERGDSDIVLTDSDFSRAYLTDGWATNFLASLFQSTTTLFVGYSHDETVMKYLAKGLAAGGGRYALINTEDDDPEKWLALGIEPLEYQYRPDSADPYGALSQTISEWRSKVNRRIPAAKEEIGRIINRGLPESDAEKATLLRAIDDSEEVQFFTGAANDPDWLGWIADKKPFLRLFEGERQPSSSERIAEWFAGTMIPADPKYALQIAISAGPRCGRYLWRQIVHGIRSNRDEIPTKVFSAWVSYLIEHQPDPRPPWDLERLLEAVSLPEDRRWFIPLFGELFKPTTNYKTRSLVGGSPRIKTNIEIDIEVHSVKKTWNEEILPNLADVGEELISLLQERVAEGERLQAAYGSSMTWDETLRIRHRAGGVHTGTELLEKIISELSVWASNEGGRTADRITDHWYEVSGLLRRAAIECMQKRQDKDPAEKARWILNTNLIYDRAVRSEMLQLLEAVLSHGQKSIDEQLLRRIAKGPPEEKMAAVDEQDRDEYAARQQFKLIDALTECGVSEQAEEHREELIEKYPALEDLNGERTTRTSVTTGYSSPQSADELLEIDVTDDEELAWLLNWTGDEPLGPRRSGLVQEARKAAQEDANWGFDLLSALADHDEWEADLWTPIITGWWDSLPGLEVVSRLLDLVESENRLDRYGDELCVLYRKIITEYADQLLGKDLARLESVSQRLLQPQGSEYELDLPIDENALMTEVLASSPGRVVDVWIASLAVRNNGDIDGLPSGHRKLFDRVLHSCDAGLAPGIPSIGRHLGLLVATDEKWVTLHLRGLLTWDSSDNCSDLRSLLLWAGYLSRPEVRSQIIDVLEKSAGEIVNRLEFLTNLSQQVASWFAALALHQDTAPLNNRWLYHFAMSAPLEMRKIWLRMMGVHLGRMDEDLELTIWEDWLGEYLRDRKSGYPAPFHREEIETLVQAWTGRVSAVFTEWVDVVLGLPSLHISNYDSRFLYGLKSSNLIATHPNSVSRLLLKALQEADPPFRSIYIEDILQEIESADVDPSTMDQIREQLIRLDLR